LADRILVVEDDAKIAALLADYLKANGCEPEVLARGDGVEERVRAGGVDLVLLDLMLPGMDGLEVCRRLRAFSDVPIVMVTARVEEIDRLLGLGMGADDYVCKPFSPREVVARIQAILRRVRARPGERASEVVLDEAGRRASIAGRDLDLTAVEFQLLRILVAQPGRIFSRQQLMDAMYADYRVVTDRTVDSHIRKLRRKIAAVLPDREIVHSVYGAGYKYEW